MRKWFFLSVIFLALVVGGCGGNGNGGGMAGGGTPDPEPEPMVTCSDGSTAASQDVCAQREADAAAAAEAAQAEVKGLTVAIADADGDGQPTGGLMKDERPGGATLTLMAAQGGVLSYGMDNLAKDDPTATIADNMEFGKSTQSAASLTGYEARVYERTMTATNDDKTTDVLRVYVDSKDAGDVNYFTYFANTNSGGTADPTAPRPTIVTGITDGGDDGKYNAGTTSLTGNDLKNEGALAFGAEVSKEDAALFDAAPFRFTKGDSGETKTYASQTDERTFAGSFAGVDGMFVCAGNAVCATTGNKDGQLTGLTGTWSFRPTKAGAEGKVEGVKLDNDYLAYGYWLQTVEKADGSMTYGVNPFATGSMVFGNNNTIDTATAVGALEGTAKYAGQATGMYALKSFESGAGVPESAGQFTADASLTANFGGNAVAVNDQFYVSGTVNNFRDSDGEHISGGAWSVDLLKAGLGTRANDGTVSAHVGTFGAMTTGGGSWTGTFYGPVTANDGSTTVDESKTGYPTGVAGEFNAHLGNGHVIGAFGATKK